MRDRLAEAEDRLFATIFLGSGLLFLAMMFVAGGVFGAIVAVHVARPESVINSTAFALARAFAYSIVNVYAIKSKLGVDSDIELLYFGLRQGLVEPVAPAVDSGK